MRINTFQIKLFTHTNDHKWLATLAACLKTNIKWQFYITAQSLDRLFSQHEGLIIHPGGRAVLD